MTLALYPHQRVGAAWLTIARRGLLGDAVGAGKTATAIHALRALYELGEDPFPILIVCPNSMKETWRRECETWWPGLKVEVVKGSSAARRRILETSAHAYVLNWEALRSHSRLAPFGGVGLRRCKECGGEDERVSPARCQVHERELNQLTFRTVIADECQKAKDARAQQTRALWSATGDAPFRFALTGTPIANSVEDLWSVMHWLAPEEFPSKVKWLTRYALMSYSAFGFNEIVGVKPDTRDEFFRVIDPRLRRMPKEAVLPFLPPFLRERRDVDMNPRQAKAYKQMKELLIAELENGDTVTTTSPLTQSIRLLQFANAYAELQTDESGQTKVRLSEPSNKIDAFLDDLPEFGDDGIVVFSQSRQLIELLSARLDKLKLPHGLITGAQTTDQRQVHIDEFQSGKTRLMLCTTQAGGVGLTLTAARIACFLNRSWSSIDEQQAEARIHRIGSERHASVLRVDYVTPGTIEEAQIDALADKGERAEEIVRDRETLLRLLKDLP